MPVHRNPTAQRGGACGDHGGRACVEKQLKTGTRAGLGAGNGSSDNKSGEMPLSLSRVLDWKMMMLSHHMTCVPTPLPLSLPLPLPQEEHVFEATQSITHVSFSVVSSATGQVLATATHPLQQAAAWGSERCRLPLQACDGAAGGGLNIRLEVKERRVEEVLVLLRRVFAWRKTGATLCGFTRNTHHAHRGSPPSHPTTVGSQ